MIISIVAALSSNKVIGKRNALPWYLPADLKHFKEITSGKPVIMGRATYESIGKPLPKRTNIILSGDSEFKVEGAIVVNSVAEAIKAAGEAPEVMIIGGASVYKQFLPLASRMYLTYIHREIAGDVFFPDFDGNEWREVSRSDFKADERNPYDYSFLVLERKNREAV
jgi:dihydrofolate reductase